MESGLRSVCVHLQVVCSIARPAVGLVCNSNFEIDSLLQANYVFVGIFVSEAIIKVLALGWRVYWKVRTVFCGLCTQPCSQSTCLFWSVLAAAVRKHNLRCRAAPCAFHNRHQDGPQMHPAVLAHRLLLPYCV